MFNKRGLVKTYRNVLFLWTELACTMNKMQYPCSNCIFNILRDNICIR